MSVLVILQVNKDKNGVKQAMAVMVGPIKLHFSAAYL